MIDSQPKILDGKVVAEELLRELRAEVRAENSPPHLVIFQIGENAASTQYVSIKERRANELGIVTEIIHLPDGFSDKELSQLIGEKALNSTGTMLQLPLPEHYDTRFLLDSIMPNKDVDGLCSQNLHDLEEGREPEFAPAVAEAVISTITHYNIQLNNKKILILGKGKYVGKPIGELIKLRYPTVPLDWADETTQNRYEQLKQADIVISCVGLPHCYTDLDLKDNAILIDVGTSLDPISKKIVGDFKISDKTNIAAYTPIPGGIGPLTVANLLKNVVKAWQRQN